ncbi:MAG TPA: acetate kinase [Actinocrinis sp.]|nr:acetate kinase [Actinocrinis sp.]
MIDGGVLVVNTGSSSVKYQVIDAVSGRCTARGLVQRTSGPGAVADVLAAEPALTAANIVAVGHRVVHGGEEFAAPVLVDDKVLAALRDLAPLAPLHIPANLAGIDAARRAFPDVPHVAVFDTAFHQSLPPHAYTYAVPRLWREEFGVRRYGFHGVSYQYVSRRAAAVLGRDLGDTNLIVLHLGNGASACAIEAGRSVETSMGLTPLEGLVMGTRSGDVDPALAAYLARRAGLGSVAVDAALNQEGGLLALAGSADLRDVWAAVDRGDPDARLAVDVYCHRIRKYVGAYYAVLGRVDAVVFTAGVGEHDPGVRSRSLGGLARLGIAVDPERNEGSGAGERFISPEGAEVPVLVVPTDEEAEIARQALDLVRTAQPGP